MIPQVSSVRVEESKGLQFIFCVRGAFSLRQTPRPCSSSHSVIAISDNQGMLYTGKSFLIFMVDGYI